MKYGYRWLARVKMLRQRRRDPQNAFLTDRPNLPIATLDSTFALKIKLHLIPGSEPSQAAQVQPPRHFETNQSVLSHTSTVWQ